MHEGNSPGATLGLHSLPALSRDHSRTGSAATIRTLWVGARLEPPHIYPLAPNPSIPLQQPWIPEGGSTLLVLWAEMLETGVGAVCYKPGKQGLVGMQNFVSLTLTTRLEKQWLSKKWEFPPRNPMLGEKKKDGADRNLSPGKRFHSCNSLAEDLTAWEWSPQWWVSAGQDSTAQMVIILALHSNLTVLVKNPEHKLGGFTGSLYPLFPRWPHWRISFIFFCFPLLPCWRCVAWATGCDKLRTQFMSPEPMWALGRCGGSPAIQCEVGGDGDFWSRPTS